MTLRFVSPCSPLDLDADRVLGGFALDSSWASDGWPWPVQSLPLPGLSGGPEALHEAWLVDQPVEAGMSEGIAWRRSGGLLFGVINPSETDADPLSEVPALRQMSEQAYRRIFRLLDQQGLPHLWRVWNYIPDIHGEQGGLERYRQFNMGRGDAFERGARSVTEQVPAACALGVTSGNLSIAFLCGASPLIPVENPRQVSAYRYPAMYGPRSPTFSRAALAYLDSQELIFVSGTASIVGHESLHAGDVVDQTGETLDNVAAVLEAAAEHSRVGRIGLSALAYRAYVRDPSDAAAVRAAILKRVGLAPVHLVQADVCREDLLVEIEAFGLRVAEPPAA